MTQAQSVDAKKTGMKSLMQKHKASVEEYYYVIEAVASVLFSKKKMPPGIEYNDLLSWGVFGLIKALDKFDDSKGVKFVTYANIRVRGEMLDMMRKEWVQRSPGSYQSFKDRVQQRVEQVLEARLNSGDKNVKPHDLLSESATTYLLSLDEVMTKESVNVSDNSPSFEQGLEEQEEYGFLNQIVQNLDEDAQKFIDLYYRKGFSQKEISIKMNYSEAKMSRIHVKVLKQLKGMLPNET